MFRPKRRAPDSNKYTVTVGTDKIEESEEEREMMVLREEINAGSRSPLKNTSFKNKKVYKHNVSVKIRR